MRTLIAIIAVVTLLVTGLLVHFGERVEVGPSECVHQPFETRKPTLEIVP